MVRVYGLLVAMLLLPLQAEAVTFKIATIAPDGTSWMKALRAGAREVKERTDGRVKFRFFPGGVMGNDKSVLRKIRIGQLHGGALTGGGLTQVCPDSQIYSLPFTFRSYDEVEYVRKQMDKPLQERLYERGYVSFGISEGGFAYMMSKQPVVVTEDLKRQKVWIPEGDIVDQEAFSAFGVSPVALPLTDVLTGLQTGLIDTVATSTVGAIALQWHTRVKYITDVPVVYLIGTLVIKRKSFEKLSTRDQEVVREVMGEVFTSLNASNRKDNKAAWTALQQQGLEVVKPAPEMVEIWRTRSAETMDRLSDGGLFRKEMLIELRQHLEEYRSGMAGSN